MTGIEKEKAINGIDVSECEKLGETIDGITCGLGKRIRFANEIITKHNLCKDNPDCYYKQLKRLQQELDIKEKMLDKFMIGSGETLEKLQKENEKLKADLKGETEQCQKWYQLETDKHFQILKYEQALEKIINIAEKLITETPEYHSCYYKDECGDNCTPKKQSKVEYCCYENVDKILTIINEALNEQK